MVELHITNVAASPDKQTLKIWEKYGRNNTTEFPELVVLRGVYLRQLAKQIQAKYLAEVGTARGFQSFMWAQYLIDTNCNHGFIYTCDVDGMERVRYQTPATGDQRFTRNQLWAGAPQSKFIVFVHGNSTKLKQSIIHKLDMLYIDGQHTEKAVLLDFQNLSPFLHPGSIVVFDDCDERYPGVQEAVKQISSSSIGAEIQLIKFTPHRYKIAVMRIG